MDCNSELLKAVCLDCQPKSKEDATYVSFKWLVKILGIAHQSYRVETLQKYSEPNKINENT